MDERLSLIFDNDIELCGGEEDGYWFEALAQGASWGDAQPVEAAVASLLADGSLVETLSNGNRVVTLQVKVCSTDPNGVAAGRARLDRATGKRTTLVWRDGDYPASVFEVQTSAPSSVGGFDDVEYLRNEQTVGLRLECLPQVRSEFPITDDAGTPPSSGGTLVDGCESTTGWSQAEAPSGSYGGTEFTVDATIFTEGTGSVRSRAARGALDAYSAGTWVFVNHDQRNGLSIDTATGGYLSTAIRAAFGSGPLSLRAWMFSLEQGEVEVTATPGQRDAAGFVRYTWPVAADLTVTAVRFYWLQRAAGWIDPATSGNAYGWYDDVRLLDAATSDKQIVKQIDVQGSARTDASLLVAAPSDSVALGEVLVISAPTEAAPPGYLPDGRRWVVQGTTTADADAPSGSYFDNIGSDYGVVAGVPVFDPPASLFTAGEYLAVVCGEPISADPMVGVQAQLRVSGTDVGVISERSQQFAHVETGRYQFLPVGTLHLPPTPVLEPTADIRVRLGFKATNFRLDDLFLVPSWTVAGRPVADFSIVDCGTGTVGVGSASSHLWLDSPSADQPRGGWWRGPDVTRQRAVSAWPDARKPGRHVFAPGPLTVWVASTAAGGVRVSLTYTPAWLGAAGL